MADKELLEIRYKSNNDSWGISFIEKASNRFGEIYQEKDNLTIVRSGINAFERFWETLLKVMDKEVLIHFRTSTSGTKKKDGIQPIISNSVAIFHNGNFPEYFGKEKTDTVLWVKNNIDPLNHLEEIEQYCQTNGSRMAFMDNNSKVYLINEKSGIWEKGMWFSNNRIGTYAGFGYSGVNYYKNEKRYF